MSASCSDCQKVEVEMAVSESFCRKSSEQLVSVKVPVRSAYAKYLLIVFIVILLLEINIYAK